MTMVEQSPPGLFDRTSHISNPIYAEVDGRKTNIPRLEYRSRLIQMQPIVIFCILSSPKKMLDGMLGVKPHKDQAYVDLVRKQHPLIVNAYRRAMIDYEGCFPLFEYAWDRDHPAQVVNFIRDVDADVLRQEIM